jgi:hypothetical protein
MGKKRNHSFGICTALIIDNKAVPTASDKLAIESILKKYQTSWMSEGINQITPARKIATVEVITNFSASPFAVKFIGLLMTISRKDRFLIPY